MRVYLINFFVWWYAVKVQQTALLVAKRFMFVLESTNTLPMAKNLTVPLFQDQSSIGKMLAIVIRSVWVWWGGMLSVAIILPLVVWLLIILVLPIAVILQIIIGIINIIV